MRSSSLLSVNLIHGQYTHTFFLFFWFALFCPPPLFVQTKSITIPLMFMAGMRLAVNMVFVLSERENEQIKVMLKLIAFALNVLWQNWRSNLLKVNQIHAQRNSIFSSTSLRRRFHFHFLTNVDKEKWREKNMNWTSHTCDNWQVNHN